MDNPDFLRTILANPADDAPRLVYADWLDEHVTDGVCPGCRGQYRTVQGWTTVESYNEAAGRYRWTKCHTCGGAGRVSNGNAERAEFIRVQCELARSPDPAGWACVCGSTKQGYRKCQACVLRARERELMAGPAFDWFKLDGLATFSDKVKGPFGGWCLKRSGEPGVDISAVVRRGFVAEVRCTAAALLGEPCGRCEGRGGRYDDPAVNAANAVVCRFCRGSGRTPGLAAALFTAHPIERVTLVDRVPYDAHGTMKPIWVDVKHAVRFGRDNPMDVPSVLFALMTEQPGVHDAHGRRPFDFWVYLEYEDTRQAVDALSAACVVYGRKLAGLALPTSSESPATAT